MHVLHRERPREPDYSLDSFALLFFSTFLSSALSYIPFCRFAKNHRATLLANPNESTWKRNAPRCKERHDRGPRHPFLPLQRTRQFSCLSRDILLRLGQSAKRSICGNVLAVRLSISLFAHPFVSFRRDLG